MLGVKCINTIRRILYGHVAGMVRCDWPFTVGYIIIIGYYTVDCTIPKYIWTSAQMATILDEPICVHMCFVNIAVNLLQTHTHVVFKLLLLSRHFESCFPTKNTRFRPVIKCVGNFLICMWESCDI